MEYSAKAYQYSQEAHQESGSPVGGKTTRTEFVKRGNGVGKQSKTKG
jgi:hypothetical protein